MEMTGIGGGIMLAVAAVLWLAYLVPSWFRRREYLATERNAVRLQQTIRVLAETAETPEAVRRELTMRAELAAQRALPRPVAVGVPVRPTQPDPRLLAARKRRTRLFASVMLLGSVVLGIAQATLMVTGGAVLGSWIVLLAAIGAAIIAGSALARLAAPAPAPVAERRDRTIVREPVERQAPQERVATSWTPVPVPKPLYLARAEAPSAPSAAAPSAAAVEAVRRQAAADEAALRATVAAVPAIPVAEESEPTQPSRFARMGVVDDASTDRPDLDALLARRRAAG